VRERTLLVNAGEHLGMLLVSLVKKERRPTDLETQALYIAEKGASRL
jgi:hypothetical protein